MLTGKQVSAVVVTRGDVDLAEIRRSLARFDDVVIWDNSKLETDAKVYGRYLAIAEARHPVVYVQDDDCVLKPAQLSALLALYTPGRVVANMPASRWDDYPDSCLVGWGSVFDADLPDKAFDAFFDAGVYHPFDAGMFDRTCDVVFTTLTPHRKVDVGFRHLSWAEDPSRAMFLQSGHKDERDRMLGTARAVRDMVAA